MNDVRTSTKNSLWRVSGYVELTCKSLHTRHHEGIPLSKQGARASATRRGHRRTTHSPEWSRGPSSSLCSTDNKVRRTRCITRNHTHLESKVFQRMSHTRLRFIATSGLNHNGNSGGRLARVDCSDFQTSGVDCGGVRARYARNAAGCRRF